MSVGLDETKVMGKYVKPHRLLVVNPEGVETGYSFKDLWEQGVSAHRLFTQGNEIKALKHDGEAWKDNTEEAKAEGWKRANRSKDGKPAVQKDAKPPMSPADIEGLRSHATIIQAAYMAGKKTQLDEETLQTVGMSAMQALTHAGFDGKGIEKLAKAYLASLAESEKK